MRIFLFILLLLCQSCAIKGNLGGLYSNYHKMQSKRPDLYVPGADGVSVCDLSQTGEPRIYLIRGEALKKCLSTKNQALVYVWGPRCKSKLCIPLEILQQQCDARNVELFVVAEYYDNENMGYTYRIKNPILGIDTKYYGSNLTSSYLSKFLLDLNAPHGRVDKFFLFRQGQFTASYPSIEALVEDADGLKKIPE